MPVLRNDTASYDRKEMTALQNSFSKIIGRVATITMVLLVILSSTFLCSAEELPYASYSYTNTDEGKIHIEDRPMYTVHTTFNGVTLGTTAFSQITDMYHDENGILYILDAGNSRVVLLNEQYQFIREITQFTYNDQVETLNKPQGLFVSKDGTLYIADTENSRVLICNGDGVIRTKLTMPDSYLIPEDFDFFPVDLICDHSGFLYVLTRGSYYGAMMFDENLKFEGFFGSNTVATSVLDGIAAIFNQLFETNEKLAVSAKKLPFQFSDFVIDQNGFFYTISASKKSGQIRKLNLASSDILTYKSGMENLPTAQYNFGETTVYSDMTGQQIEQNFGSISVNDDGYIFALDSAYGKIYVYDWLCNSVTVFGGGMSAGSQKGTFQYATSIETVGNQVLVADEHTNEVTVFSLTSYGNLIMKANSLTMAGNYDDADVLWREVLKLNSTSVPAYTGLTKSALFREDYEQVFEYSRKAGDKESYAVAFDQLSKQYLADNLWWIFLLIIGVVASVILLSVYLKKRQVVLVGNIKVRTATRCLVHPFEAFDDLKRKKQGSFWISLILLALFYISAVGQDLWCGFMYAGYTADYNIWLKLGGSVGVVVLWVIVEWAVSTLFEGKGRIGEILCVTCYSLVPTILFRVFYIIYSYAVVPSSASFLSIIEIVCLAYTVVLMVVGLITIHEFSLFKVVGTSILTAFGMIIVVFILLMVFSLAQNFVAFIVNIFSEAIYR